MYHRHHDSGSHPNMLGATLIAGVLGAIMTALVINEIVTTGTTTFTSVLFTVVLLGLAVMSFRVHRKLAGMTFEQREAYWHRFDEAHRENHERNVEAYVRRGRDGDGLG